VDIRFALYKVAEVDTVKSSTFVNIKLVMYWTDSRLAGWEGALPRKLWGPIINVENALQGFETYQDTFALSDRAEGRLKRMVYFVGHIANAMDLQDFPFDTDEIEVEFITTSHFRSLDWEALGSLTSGKAFRLRPICRSGEGSWGPELKWDGAISEWELRGVSAELEAGPPSSFGTSSERVRLSIHVSRKYAFYFWKALLPLYMLTALNLTALAFEVDDLSDRIATTATFFLAAFAMLYVVGASLPKTDFLTKVDVVIVLTTGSLLLIGLASVLLAMVHEKFGAAFAQLCNTAFGWALVMGNVLTNLIVFVPALVRSHKAERHGREPIRYASPTAAKSRKVYLYTPCAKLLIPKKAASDLATHRERASADVATAPAAGAAALV